MLVQDIMQTHVVTIPPDTTLPAAIRLTRERGFRHLPVVDDERLVGIVSDRDLKQAMASPATSLGAHDLQYLLDRVRIDAIMTRAVVTIAPMFPVEEAARMMVTGHISALPVTDGGKLVGMITETDVLRLFVRALGAGEPSSRIDVMLGRERSALPEVIAALDAAGAAISSVMTLAAPDGQREAIIRLATIHPGPAVHALQAKGYTVRQPPRA